MAALELTNTKAQNSLEDKFKELQISLPKISWFGVTHFLYQGFWCPHYFLESVSAFQTHFQAHDTDIILASMPKTGTTWLKSLLFAIVNRKKLSDDKSKHPLYNKSPHELVLHLEIKVFKNISGDQPALDDVPLPRLFATHMPYQPLPDSIKDSKCRVVYVGRNPLDTFVSSWYFYLQFEETKSIEPNLELMNMEEYVGKYCKGTYPFGPYEDHVLGYWKESKENPQKVLFLEYEGLKKEPKAQLIRLAEFVGCPFSAEEEKGNVIDEIIELCSIKSLKDMEINKSGKFYTWFENKILFRKGEVGDWTNDLTPSMAKQFHQMLEKLKEDGFSFAYYQT